MVWKFSSICLLSMLFYSCSTTGVSYSAKRFEDTIRDDSFKVNEQPVRTDFLYTDVTFAPLITDISGQLRKRFKKPKQYLDSDFRVQGEIFKSSWVDTDEFALAFVLGLQTEAYIFEGAIVLDSKQMPVTMTIYYLHNNEGLNRQYHTVDVKTDAFSLHPLVSYYGREDSSPFLAFTSKGNELEFNVFITQTLNWNVHGELSANEVVVNQNWPRIGIKSLLNLESQVLQVCDGDNTVLAEIKKNKNVFKYVTYITQDDERYEGVVSTIGLVMSYMDIFRNFDDR